jgi:hypothetical protein
MTYGANGGQVRDALATLLRQHRIQQRLGGAGSHTIPETTTVEERAALGALIARYRHAVLVYCRISVTAVNPNTPLDGTSVRTRGPAEELRYRLDRAVEGSTTGLPTMDELTTPQNLDLVESWRRAAQASALGEHDFPAGLSWGTLTDQQCRTVLNDAAEITQGLVVLDQRHTNIPGWAALPDCASLGRAAQVCTVFAGYDGQDHTVDLRGRRPPLEMIDGPDPGGFAGLIQTEQNLLIHLTRFPDARGLRLVIDSQRVLSHQLGVRVREDFPTISNHWAGRAATYTSLAQQCRNLAGLVGDARKASADGSILPSRLQKVPSSQPLAPEQANSLRALATCSPNLSRSNRSPASHDSGKPPPTGPVSPNMVDDLHCSANLPGRSLMPLLVTSTSTSRTSDLDQLFHAGVGVHAAWSRRSAQASTWRVMAGAARRWPGPVATRCRRQHVPDRVTLKDLVVVVAEHAQADDLTGRVAATTAAGPAAAHPTSLALGREVVRLGPVVGGAQLPHLVVEGRQLDTEGPGHAVPGYPAPAAVVNASVAEHLEVLRLVPFGRVGAGEGGGHADALERPLLHTVHAEQFRQAGGLEHRVGATSITRWNGGADLAPGSDPRASARRSVAGATPVRGHRRYGLGVRNSVLGCLGHGARWMVTFEPDRPRRYQPGHHSGGQPPGASG